MVQRDLHRLAGLLLVGALCLAAHPLAQGPDIDALIARGSHFASPQTRRADLAIPDFQQALALAERHRQVDRGALAAARLGAAYRSTHQPAAALAVLERGISLARDAARPDLEGLCLRTIGNIRTEEGEYEEAARYFHQALSLAERENDAELKVAALNSLSASARLQGRLDGALEFARAGLQLVDARLGAGESVDPQAQFALPFNVGKALADGGDYAGALEYFERAFTAADAHGLVSGVWHALFDTAEWYQGQGDLDRAAAYYRRALEQSRKTESRDMEANTIRGLASVAEARGDLADAITQYGLALEMYEKYSFAARVPSTIAALARVQREANRIPEAEATLRRAVRYVRAGSGPLDRVRIMLEVAAAARARGALPDAARGYEEARVIAAEHGLRPLAAVAASGLARVVHDQGDAARALRLYALAEEAFRRVRMRISAPDQRMTFSDATHATFAGELDLLMDLARRHPGAGYDRQAFLTVERERAQDLAGTLADGRLVGTRHLSPDRRERQARAGARLAEVQAQLMNDALPAERRRALRAEQDDAEREWDAIGAADAIGADREADDVHPFPDRLESLQQALAPGEAFVAYTSRHAFVLTSRGLLAVVLPAVTDLGTRADLFVRLLAGDDPAGSIVAGRIVSSALVAPVLAALPPETSRLVISAAGPMAGIPFGALPDPARREPTPLLAAYEITYASSAGALARARGAGSRPKARGLLAVANPPAMTSRAQLAAANRSRIGSFGPLPYSQDEVERAATHASGRSRILTGASATEHQLKQLPLEDFGVLHFATHAVLDPVVPMRSAIVLGPGSGEDGLLQAREIFQLPVAADLVILSACRTAAGRVSSAEGMPSLARAFMYAGARAVIGTLWDVDDRPSADLMGRFYDGQRAGLPAAAALRAAQLAMMGRDPYATAPRWAAFVLAGDGTVLIEVSPRRPWNARLALVGLVGGMMAVLALAVRRRIRRPAPGDVTIP